MKIATNVAFAATTPYFGKPVTIVFLWQASRSLPHCHGGERAGEIPVGADCPCRRLHCRHRDGLGNLDAIASAPWFRTFRRSCLMGLSGPTPADLTTVLIYMSLPRSTR